MCSVCEDRTLYCPVCSEESETVPCPRCNGDGKTYYDEDGNEIDKEVYRRFCQGRRDCGFEICERCGGSGKIEDNRNPFDNE